MADPDVNALRLILHVVDFKLWPDDVPRLVRGALSRRERGIWNTTVADAWGAVALQHFAAAFESTPVTGTTTMRLAGTEQRVEWTTPPAPVSLPWPDQPAELTVEQNGTGSPWLTVSSRAAIPLREPLSSGYRISKTVTPLEPRVPGVLSVGDKLRVRLEVDAQSDMTWVVVDDPVPAGASHLGSGLARDSQIGGGETADQLLPPDFVERRFEAYRAYYDFVPKGPIAVEYTIRLNQSGRFEMPPTRVEALYAPEMFGEIPNAVVEVRP